MRPRPRWWLAVVLALIGLGAFAWIWLRPGMTRQDNVLATLSLVTVFLLAELLWLLLLSRLRWRVRGIALGALVLVAGLFVALVEFRGVTGDLVPILAWRWSGPPAEGVKGPGAAGEAALRSWQSPQFLGPDRNAVLRGFRIARDWQATPPREVWRRPVGAAWSSFAVRDGVAITQEQREDREVVAAYELATGRPLWQHSDEARYETSVGGVGPRGTPTLVGQRVFTLGATGILNALDFGSGKQLWQRKVLAEAGAEAPPWGKSASPLALGPWVVVPVGGQGHSLMAFEQADGETVWSAGDDLSAYSSPLVTELGGVEQIVSFNEGSVTGHALEDGAVLWRYPWNVGQPNVAQPIPLGGDRLLVSAGYAVGSHLLQIRRSAEGWQVETLWQSPRLKLKFTQAVFHQGFLYGLDDGVLVCLDPETGERRWKKGRYGHGQILLVEDLLLVQTEDGELVLIDPQPEGLEELARLPVLSGRAWNSLAMAGPYLLLRNHQEAVCLELPGEAVAVASSPAGLP